MLRSGIDKTVLDELNGICQGLAPPPDERGPAEFPFRRLPADAQCPGARDGDAYPSASCFIGNCRYNPWQDPVGVL